MSKLDRFLVCNNFLRLFPNASATALPRELSDHCPISLHTVEVDFGKAPFRFFNSWMQRKGFENLVRDSWEKFRGYGIPDVYMAAKLRFLKNEIKTWRATDYTKEMMELKELKNRTQDLDNAAEIRCLSSAEFNERLCGFQRITELEKFVLMDLKQRSRIKWIMDGDENSRFFHGYVNNKRCKNRIHGLMVDGEWTTDPTKIKNVVYNFYQEKFQERWPSRPKFISGSFSRLSPRSRSEIEEPFTIDEIMRAVWACGGDKAPRPDGFTFSFIKRYWEILQHDIVKFVKYFERYGKLERGCNSSFINIIPKIKDPLHLRDYRPISLIGCQYKIISKILANRIKGVIDQNIGEAQSAYVEGRNILDGPLIINELCSWAKKSKKQVLLFKVDFEKAFDSVNWEYLDSIISQLGYGEKWRMWIRGCLHSARLSVLVNGSPTKEFEMKKGVRQGDPLSSFLFIIAMEGLNIAMKEAC